MSPYFEDLVNARRVGDWRKCTYEVEVTGLRAIVEVNRVVDVITGVYLIDSISQSPYLR